MIVLMFIMKLSSCMSSSCAPPPHPMWCVAVSCYVPPPTWSMGLPSCCCCYRQCASGSFSYFGEAVLIHLFFVRFLILFFVVISSSIALETMFRGMLPTLLQLFPKTTCFIPTSCTHTRRSVGPPASYPPSAIHTVHIQKPSRSLIQTPHIH